MGSLTNQAKILKKMSIIVSCLVAAGSAVVIANPSSFAFDHNESILEVGKFSAEKPGNRLPNGWEPLVFKNAKRRTTYILVQDADKVVVEAKSIASASGLLREIRIDPKKYRFVKWRWKVNNILKKSDIHRREGDDYSARIYIAFADDPKNLNIVEKAESEAIRLMYGKSPPSAAITYLWESKEPIGTVAPAFYSNRIMMIVVESGAEKLHQWVTEERNVYEDFKRVFGREPPAITGVAIVTETDNTGESATAYYGDINFMSSKTGS